MAHTRRALVAGLAALPAIASTAVTAAAPMSEADRVMAGHGLDLAAIRSRVELVAKVLELPASEVELAMSDPADQSLIEFALRYGQGLGMASGRRSAPRCAREVAPAWCRP